MLTIEEIQGNPYYKLDEVTPEVVALLKENPGVGVYVDTGRTIKRVVGRYYLRPNGQREFARFEQQSVRGMSADFMPLSNQLAKVFDPDAYAKRMGWKEEEKARRKAQQDGRDAIAVGTIFEGSCGYDATISKFYQVVKSSDKSVWVRPIRQSHEPSYGPCCWKASGIKDAFCGDVERHPVNWRGGNPSIKVGSRYCRIWDGKPVENDNYH